MHDIAIAIRTGEHNDSKFHVSLLPSSIGLGAVIA
jgi:hypothetical protein